MRTPSLTEQAQRNPEGFCMGNVPMPRSTYTTTCEAPPYRPAPDLQRHTHTHVEQRRKRCATVPI
eukprot:1340259-Alexandrium_andersonii.AAC.1